MGPRHECRGEVRQRVVMRRRRVGFNGATARMPWRDPLGVRLLSALNASMGPRTMPWRAGGRPPSRVSLYASMGHGTNAVERPSGACGKLDDSSASNGATARMPWRASGEQLSKVEFSVLQWGHGTNAVERPMRLTNWPAFSCFNGPRHECRGEDDATSVVSLGPF